MLHEAGRRKDVFPTILAHELRNPVAPIRNVAAQVVKERRESLPRDLRRMQEIVKRQCPVRAADRWWFRRWSVCLVEDADGVATRLDMCWPSTGERKLWAPFSCGRSSRFYVCQSMTAA